MAGGELRHGYTCVTGTPILLPQGGTASAPRRERLMEKRRGDRVFLVLPVPMELGEEYRDVFVPPRATLVHCLQVHGDFSVLSHSSTHLGRERRRNEGSRY